MKVGDLVMCAPDAYGDESLIGIVLETDVNMWGEEVIPTGVRVLWPEDITVETEDELEVYNA